MKSTVYTSQPGGCSWPLQKPQRTQRAQRNTMSSRFVFCFLPPSFDDFSTKNDCLWTVDRRPWTFAAFPKSPYLSNTTPDRLQMKRLTYPLLLSLFLLPLFSTGTPTDTTRLILQVSNSFRNPVTLRTGDWQYEVAPGKTVQLNEAISGLSIPFTIDISTPGVDQQGGTLNTELRIYDLNYTNRKLSISKTGTMDLQSIAAEMDWYQFNRIITPFTVYSESAALIARDPGSPAVSDILASYICRAKFSPDSIETLYNLISPAQQASPRGRIVAGYIEGRRALTTGKIMQDFMLPDSSGKMVSLYSIQSRYILIDFWFSTCKPCIEGFPALQELYAKTNREDLTIIGISVDAGAMLPNWRSSIRKYQLPWINLSDPEYSIPYYRYGIEQYPTQVLIDREKRIVGVGSSEIERFWSLK
jgi:peroxiredoxin